MHHSRFADFEPYFILIYFNIDLPSGLYDVVFLVVLHSELQ